MENPKFNITIFALGCVGAIAPEIIRLFNLREQPSRFIWSWFYLVITLFFVALGGIIAWILPTTTYYGAFYAGVTTPILITSILKNATSLRKSGLTNYKKNLEIKKKIEHFEGLSEKEKIMKRNDKRKSDAAGAVRFPSIYSFIIYILKKLLFLFQNYIYAW